MGSASDLPGLRREVRAFLERHADPGGDVDAAELAVSELVSNGLRHTSGPVWLTLDWSRSQPVAIVRDTGAGFDPEIGFPAPPPESVGGRGLFVTNRMAGPVETQRRSGAGSVVRAPLPVSRSVTPAPDPPKRTFGALPRLDEVGPNGAFGKEVFLRALVVQLARTIERDHGPDAASAAVSQVGSDIGGQMEAEYRAAHDLVGRLTPAQIADCYVRLKHAIDGAFRIVEVDERRIVLANTRCPFGKDVEHAPTLCHMTSSVFGGIAARNTAGDAVVVSLDERIAVGDPGCRVTVWFSPDDAPGDAPRGARFDPARPLER